MTRLLGLDLGNARTGVAFADDTADFVMALDTVSHRTTEELITAIQRIASEKKVERIIIGLPRLPGGEEGEQAKLTRSVAARIASSASLPIEFIDERYSSTVTHKDIDNDAKAACDLLTIFLSKKRSSNNR